MVDVQSVGAGGGSIARVRQGALLVGPESAGARRPGRSVTGVEAHGRRSRMRTRCSATSPSRDSRPGACTSTSTAHAPPSSAMSRSRSVSTSSRRRGASSGSSTPTWRTPLAASSRSYGADPRDLAIIAYGGNGAVHAWEIATELGIDRILVPKAAPAFSALGVLVADYVVDLVRAYVVPLSQVDLGRVRGAHERAARGSGQGARADRAPRIRDRPRALRTDVLSGPELRHERPRARGHRAR